MEGFFVVRRSWDLKYRRAGLALLLSLLLLSACQGGQQVSLEESGQTPSTSQAPAVSSSAPEREPSGAVSLPTPDAEPKPEPAPEPLPEPEPAIDPAPELETDPEPKPVPEPEPEQKPERPANHTLYILMYHHFVEGSGEGLNNWTLTRDRFREDLQWLADHGYTTVLPSQLAAGEPLPERAVMLTFDDGYASNYQIAYPLLQEFGDQAVISLIVRYTQEGEPDWLTWDMCREMAQSGLVEFGSHTYESHDGGNGIRHEKGEKKDDYQARIFPDLQTSIDLIEENVGVTVQFFAYPHGKTEPWASGFLAEHFAVTVTTRHGPANVAWGLYDLPRHNVAMSTPLSEYLPD